MTGRYERPPGQGSLPHDKPERRPPTGGGGPGGDRVPGCDARGTGQDQAGSKVTCIFSARLREASGLEAVLDAAYDVFEGMLLVIGACQDHAGGLFAAFGKSAASAADGRNAILLAPSLPSRCLHEKPAPTEDSHCGEDMESIAACLAAVSLLLADRLTQAAKSAPDYRDRAASRSAARRARDIHGLLTDVGQ